MKSNSAISTIEQRTALAPRPRPRVRLANALDLLGRAAGVELDATLKGRLFEMPDDEFDALLQGLAAGVAKTVAAAHAKIPSIDAEIENFAQWQGAKGALFIWPAAAMEALRAKMTELGEGVELIPCFAMSVQVKLRSGRLILIGRDGRETKS